MWQACVFALTGYCEYSIRGSHTRNSKQEGGSYGTNQVILVLNDSQGQKVNGQFGLTLMSNVSLPTKSDLGQMFLCDL